MPAKVGQETGLKKENLVACSEVSVKRKVEKRKVFLTWPFVPNGQLTKEQELLKAVIVLCEIQSTHIVAKQEVCFAEGNTSDHLEGTEFG